MGRDSAGKRLGVKVNHGEAIKIGQIIIRQRGTKYAPGANVKVGRDDTLYSVANGKVAYSHKKLTKFDGRLKLKTIVGVK